MLTYQQNVDKPILSMEIKIANIAYISNCPKALPNHEHPTIKNQSTNQTHITTYRIQHSSNNSNVMEIHGIVINQQKKPIVKKILTTNHVWIHDS